MATPVELWQGGLSLAAAAFVSASGARWQSDEAQLRNAYDRLRTDPRSPLLDRAAALTALQDLAAASDALAAGLADLRDGLRRRLAAGEARALGFRAAKGPGGCLRLAAIEPWLWHAGSRIDWQVSALATNNGLISDIRVIAAPALSIGQGTGPRSEG